MSAHLRSCVLQILQTGSGFHQRMAGWQENGIFPFLSGKPNGGGGCLREKGGGCAQRSPLLWAILTYNSVPSHSILHSERTVAFCFPYKCHTPTTGTTGPWKTQEPLVSITRPVMAPLSLYWAYPYFLGAANTRQALPKGFLTRQCS